jgi:hypothetical protein
MTDAPSTVAPASTDRLGSLVAEWRTDLTGQVSVSASGVQDRLLELWGQLGDGQGRAQVEGWLTETLGRHLYEVADIDARLDQLLASESVTR